MVIHLSIYIFVTDGSVSDYYLPNSLFITLISYFNFETSLANIKEENISDENANVIGDQL